MKTSPQQCRLVLFYTNIKLLPPSSIAINPSYKKYSAPKSDYPYR